MTSYSKLNFHIEIVWVKAKVEDDVIYFIQLEVKVEDKYVWRKHYLQLQLQLELELELIINR